MPADAVKATVNNHWITLTGRAALELPARDRSQLRRSNSRCRRRPQQHHHQPGAHGINIEARGTELELTGTVHSWHEFREASQAAWATPGVTHVQNKLNVAS